jgi:SAM-dependent methyltransferase
MRSLLTRLFHRLARALGILELQHRLDRVDVEASRSHEEYLQQLGAMERFLRRRLENDSEVLSSRLSTEVIHLQNRVEDVQTALLRHIESVTNEVQEALVRHLTAHTEAVVNEVRLHVENEMSQVRRESSHLRTALSQLTQSGSAHSLPIETSNPQVVIDDVLYAALEDRFRGDRNLIKERQMEYLEFLPTGVTESKPVLDLGCGRGEWLELMMTQEIPAVGVDSNLVAIDECVRKGLDVTHADLFSFLKSMKAESVSAVTMYQVLEHLPFSLLVDTFREIRRVLIPGGVFIAEVPNSETLSVGASTFWIDPTHHRPLHPQVLSFLAQQSGFRSSVHRTFNELKSPPHVIDASDSAVSAILDLHHAIYGPGDVAIIATA